MTYAGAVLLLLAGLWSSPALGLELGEAVAKALASHPRLTALAHEKQSLDHRQQVEQGSRWPTLDFLSHAGVERARRLGGVDAGKPQLAQNRIELVMRQSLYDGGAAENALQAAEQRALAARWRLLEAQEMLALEVVESFLQILQRQATLALSAKNAEWHQSFLQKVGEGVEAGFSSSTDLDQLTGRLALLQANMEADQGILAIEQAKLASLVGESLSVEEDYYFPEGLWPASEEEAMAWATDNRPLLAALQIDIQVAESEYQAAKAHLQPVVELELGTSRNEGLGGYEGQNQSARAMVNMRYNLFRGGSDQARLQEYASRLASAKEQARAMQRTVASTVQADWRAMTTSRKKVAYLQKHLAASQRVAGAYRQEFTLGKRSLLETLHAETEMINALSSLVTEEFVYQLHALRLLGHGGGLVAALLPADEPVAMAKTEDRAAVIKALDQEIERLTLERFISPYADRDEHDLADPP